VAKKPQLRRKHVPQRTCVGCRTVLPKQALTRLVRTPAGVSIDPTGKLAGRGAYLHNLKPCWERALKGSLASALKTTLTTEDSQQLQQYLETLPAGSTAEPETAMNA
jgi:predicted RNA-binding protein YlxR (DUF448 family)